MVGQSSDYSVPEHCHLGLGKRGTAATCVNSPAGAVQQQDSTISHRLCQGTDGHGNVKAISGMMGQRERGGRRALIHWCTTEERAAAACSTFAHICTCKYNCRGVRACTTCRSCTRGCKPNVCAPLPALPPALPAPSRVLASDHLPELRHPAPQFCASFVVCLQKQRQPRQCTRTDRETCREN